MRGDGSEPPRCDSRATWPAAGVQVRRPMGIGCHTSGPLTVVYYVGIVRRNNGTLTDSGLFAAGSATSAGGSFLIASATPPAGNCGRSESENFTPWCVLRRAPRSTRSCGTNRRNQPRFVTAKVDRDASRASQASRILSCWAISLRLARPILSSITRRTKQHRSVRPGSTGCISPQTTRWWRG